MILFAAQIAHRVFILMALLLAMASPSAQAQSSCSSDGQRAPVALVERFISADCDTCWADPATALVKATELALDWIVPSAKGDDAPLSAAASRDALARLQALRKAVPASSINVRQASTATRPTKPAALRVARGVALGGYIGTSIELTHSGRNGPASIHPMTAWLLLIEAIPAGADGTPVARNLVRNALQLSWNDASSRPISTGGKAGRRFYESRPMSIPAGANPDRLRAVGWVEEPNGKLITSAASVCAEQGKN